MDKDEPPPPTTRRWRPTNPIKFIASRVFRKTLEETGPALTFARLCTSRHLEDLQWIAFMMIVLIMVALGVAVYSFAFQTANDAASSIEKTLASAAAAVAAGVLNWAYQTANRRIGAIDLFACEISVICRVALVVDFARSSIKRAEDADAPPAGGEQQVVRADLATAEGVQPQRFTSQEQYTPVYDNMLADLVPLDVNVVTFVTEFYTYRKTMVDYLRAIAATDDAPTRGALLAQMNYMQFLMYESGRFAIHNLIEFEPNQAESIINVLCSEIPLYAFLINHYENDFRAARLRLRCRQYRSEIASLQRKMAAANRHPNWIRAETTMPELLKRYEAMCASLPADLAPPRKEKRHRGRSPRAVA